VTAPVPPFDDAPLGEVLVVTPSVAIPRAELDVRATRAGGPGGQHVNTSSTRIELRWNVRTTQAVDDARRAWLLERLATRLDGEGFVRVVASEFRSQRQNRDAAEARLADLVRRALHVPKKRKATKPSRAAKAKRLDAKRKHSDKKRERRTDFD
jgi:ribosome-associated protein